MKLSLAWIFDHIKVAKKDVDIVRLLKNFSSKTAEIDEIVQISVDLDQLTLAKITGVSQAGIDVESVEFNRSYTLPERKDALMGQWYLIKVIKKVATWATMADLGSSLPTVLPELWAKDDEAAGGWKNHFEKEDTVIIIDNKALTHRPDMWGHRGVAREVAALLDKPLVPEEDFLVSKPIKHYTSSAPVSSSNPFTVEITAAKECHEPCKRFAMGYISDIQVKPSLIEIASRLARIDSKPIDAIVDATNYVMFDIVQPMHAFDAKKITTHALVGRCAHDGETLALLDGTCVTLSHEDYVITDGKKPLALAGIMGGVDTKVTSATTALVIEAANFDATVIRKTSARLKKRTESSARFEKSLDPNQNTQALLRFLKLMQVAGIAYKSCENIVSVGPLAQERTLAVEHSLIEARIGMHVSVEKVQEILVHLGFGVQIKEHLHQSGTQKDVVYLLTIPTNRATKDVTIAEDISEEVARFIGYDLIMPVAPMRQMVPFDTGVVFKTREIKQQMAYGLGMHEIQTYAFFDEEFIARLPWEPKENLSLHNPFSQNIKRLVTTLIPNMLKCLELNLHKKESLRFFELNRIWYYDHEPVEKKELAGLFFEHKKEINFYQIKAELASLFDLLGLEVTWQKPSQQLEPWYNKNMTAELVSKGEVFGTFGMMDAAFLKHVAQGQAIIFEINADHLIKAQSATHIMQPLKKFQETHLDLSMFVPHHLTVAELEKTVQASDPKIQSVRLIDFYEKPELINQRGVTLRFIIYDDSKTLVKEEIDAVWDKVTAAVKKLGAQVR